MSLDTSLIKNLKTLTNRNIQVQNVQAFDNHPAQDKTEHLQNVIQLGKEYIANNKTFKWYDLCYQIHQQTSDEKQSALNSIFPDVDKKLINSIEQLIRNENPNIFYSQRYTRGCTFLCLLPVLLDLLAEINTKNGVTINPIIKKTSDFFNSTTPGFDFKAYKKYLNDLAEDKKLQDTPEVAYIKDLLDNARESYFKEVSYQDGEIRFEGGYNNSIVLIDKYSGLNKRKEQGINIEIIENSQDDYNANIEKILELQKKCKSNQNITVFSKLYQDYQTKLENPDNNTLSIKKSSESNSKNTHNPKEINLEQNKSSNYLFQQEDKIYGINNNQLIINNTLKELIKTHIELRKNINFVLPPSLEKLFKNYNNQKMMYTYSVNQDNKPNDEQSIKVIPAKANLLEELKKTAKTAINTLPPTTKISAVKALFNLIKNLNVINPSFADIKEFQFTVTNDSELQDTIIMETQITGNDYTPLIKFNLKIKASNTLNHYNIISCDVPTLSNNLPILFFLILSS